MRSDLSHDSIDMYLRQVSEIELLNPLEQQHISAGIEDAERTMQTLLAHLGFSGSEYIRMIDACLAGENHFSDFFRPSSLRQQGDSAALPSLFSQWKKEISNEWEKLQKLFSAGKKGEKNREHLAKILSRYTLNCSQINEQKEIFLNYLRMADPAFEARGKTFSFAPERIREDQKTLLEEKLLLPVSELTPLLSDILAAATRMDELRNRIVEGNLRLVISIAQKYRNRGIAFGDLIQEGNLGMLKALDRFDFQLGYRFTTYASWWIRHNITHAIAEQGRVIRLPGHMIKAIAEINRAEQQFIQLHGWEPETAELAKVLELPEARVSAMRKMAMQPISLQSAVGNDEDSSLLEDLIASDKNSDPSGEIARKLLYDRLHAMLQTLPERDQQIIIMRFGFFGFPVMPHAEISRRFHLTRERIRQLESKILATLRSPEKIKYIDGTQQWEG